MGKNGVKVIIRTRPTANFATSQILIDSDESTVTVHASSSQLGSSPTKHHADNTQSIASVAAAAPSNRKDSWKFKFHQVLHNAGQDKVYEAIARDIVYGAVVDGVNGTILAYGQTGAGKSFTMLGDTRNYQHRGIAPRAVAQVYDEVENRIETAYAIKVSYMEIYNDRIYDLLESSSGTSNPSDYVVVEDARGTYVRGLTQVEVTSEQAALDQLFYGELQRTVAEHQLNKRSNRSHCIFTFYIAQKSRAGGHERVVHSKLHLVDLAGSERLKKTVDDAGDRSATTTIKKESMYINQSLSFLEQCIVALSAKDPQRHIPYRQTKLTHVLRDALGGNAKTLMFACIWGESKHLEETISTLKLAQRMMRVQNEVAAIVENDPVILLRKYEKQIKDLKHELVMHDALVERPGGSVVYDEHTPEQKAALLQSVHRFVDAPTRDDEDDALKLTSVHEIRELFRQFKRLLLLQRRSGDSDGLGLGSNSHSTRSIRAGSAGSTRTQTSMGVRADSHDGLGKEQHHVDFVGDDDPSGASGFGLGVVSSAARPSTIDAVKKSKQRDATASGAKASSKSPTHKESDRGGGNGNRSQHRSPSPTRPTLDTNVSNDRSRTTNAKTHAIDDGDDVFSAKDDDTTAATMQRKSDAFRVYKTTGAGKQIQQSLVEEKEKVAAAKHKLQQLSRRVNAVKAQIDAVQAQLEHKRTQRSSSSSGTSLTNASAQRGANGARAAASTKAPSGVAQPRHDAIVDEEEFVLMTSEREAKREYRSLFDDLQAAKAELAFTVRSVELVRMRLVREFDDWYDATGGRDAIGYSGKNSGSGSRRGHALSSLVPTGGGDNDDDNDKLDDGEQFDQLEVERVRLQDPDSLAFFQAQKKMRQQQQQQPMRDQARKPKRG